MNEEGKRCSMAARLQIGCPERISSRASRGMSNAVRSALSKRRGCEGWHSRCAISRPQTLIARTRRMRVIREILSNPLHGGVYRSSSPKSSNFGCLSISIVAFVQDFRMCVAKVPLVENPCELAMVVQIEHWKPRSDSGLSPDFSLDPHYF